MADKPTYEELAQKVLQLEEALAIQKELEASLKTSGERFQLAMKFGSGGHFDWNLETNEIFYSSGWKRLLGYEDHEIKNDFSEWERLTHPDDVKASWEMLNDLLAKKIDRFELEFKMLHKDGHWVDILSRANAVFDETGKAIRVVGSHADITEKKLAEKSLRDSEEMFRALFKQSGGYCMILEPHESGIPTILDANEKACEAHGFTREELIGRPVADLDDDEGKRLCVERTKIIMSGEPFSIQTDHLRKDGSIFPVAVCASRVDFTDRSPLIVTTEYDITDMRKAEASRLALEKQLLQSRKIEAVGVLAGGIAHDFNNMLGVITGNVSYLLSVINDGVSISNTAEFREVLLEVQDGARQAQKLTQQLLTFSKGGKPIKKVVDLNPLIVESAKFVSRGKKSRCDFNLAKDLWPVEIDSGQINQTINNLVINANQAMPEGGIINIQSENTEIDESSGIPLPKGKYIKIVVSDEGVGISEKHMEKIFDPYFSTKQSGSGLGLATTYSIVNQHGGHILVDSKLEEGTSFSIYLPASFKVSEGIVEEQGETHNGKGRILIMDDQKPILKMAGRMLSSLGYDTSLAIDGLEAIEMYKEALESSKPYIFVILDLTVPGGMGGAKVVPELLKLDPKVRAVVSSGYSNDPIMSSYRDYGFCGLIPKPYTRSELAALCNEILKDG